MFPPDISGQNNPGYASERRSTDGRRKNEGLWSTNRIGECVWGNLGDVFSLLLDLHKDADDVGYTHQDNNLTPLCTRKKIIHGSVDVRRKAVDQGPDS